MRKTVHVIVEGEEQCCYYSDPDPTERSANKE